MADCFGKKRSAVFLFARVLMMLYNCKNKMIWNERMEMETTRDKDSFSELLRAFRTAFPATIPVLTGYLFLGLAYGVLMETKGYGPLWSFLMSALAFGGSMQFVAITLLTTAFDPVQAFLMSIMVNARHLFYGLTMLEKYKGLGKLQFPTIFMLSDETFSLTSSLDVPEGIKPRYYYFAISFLDYGYWVISSVLGGLLGSMLSWDMEGLDFALTALFVVIFTGQMEKKENRIPGLIGIFGTLAVLFVVGADALVIPSMAVILVILLMGRKWICY